jgi:hypothetical protein
MNAEKEGLRVERICIVHTYILYVLEYLSLAVEREEQRDREQTVRQFSSFDFDLCWTYLCHLPLRRHRAHRAHRAFFISTQTNRKHKTAVDKFGHSGPRKLALAVPHRNTFGLGSGATDERI